MANKWSSIMSKPLDKSNKTRKDYVAEIYKPNRFLQPVNYLTFKMMESVAESDESKYMGSHAKPFLEFFSRFSRNWGGVFGLLIFLVLILLALIVPLTTVDPTSTDGTSRFLRFFTDGNILGTDFLGRDVWAQLWWGLRFSLGIAISAAIIDIVVGVSLGIIMGYFDMADRVLQFLIKIFSNIPTIIIMILATLVFSPSFFTIVGSLVITGWIGTSNQVRAQVKRARNFEWIKASRVLGSSDFKILKSFVPVIIPILITQLVFSVPGAILAETGLAFIGLGIKDTATLGGLISDGATYVTLYPRLVLVPSFILVFLTTSIQLIGNATQDALRRQR